MAHTSAAQEKAQLADRDAKAALSALVGPTEATQLPPQPSESTPVYAWIPLAGAVIYAHLALAAHYGLSLERVLGLIPEPWLTLVKFLGASAVLWLAKAPVLDLACARAFGFSRRRTWNTRWTVDNYHLGSTLLGAWAVILCSEVGLPPGVSVPGVLAIGFLVYSLAAICLNICARDPPPARLALLARRQATHSRTAPSCSACSDYDEFPSEAPAATTVAPAAPAADARPVATLAPIPQTASAPTAAAATDVKS